MLCYLRQLDEVGRELCAKQLCAGINLAKVGALPLALGLWFPSSNPQDVCFGKNTQGVRHVLGRMADGWLHMGTGGWRQRDRAKKKHPVLFSTKAAMLCSRVSGFIPFCNILWQSWRICPLAQLFRRLWSSSLAFGRDTNFTSFDEQFLLVRRRKGLCLLLYTGEIGLLSAAFIAVPHSPQLLHWRQVLARGAQDISLKRAEVHFGNFNQRTVMGNGTFASGSSWVSPAGVWCLLAPSHVDVQPTGLPKCLAKFRWRWAHCCQLSQSWLRAASRKAEPICKGQLGSWQHPKTSAQHREPPLTCSFWSFRAQSLFFPSADEWQTFKPW